MVLGVPGKKHPHHEDTPENPEKPEKPELLSTAPVLGPALISPTGTISGAPANNGEPWARINQYDASYSAWGQHVGLDPNLCKRMTVVESAGVNLTGGEAGSTGILQIKPDDWNDTARALGVSLYTPDGQIAVCNAILAGTSGHGDYGGWEQNFRRLYFTGDDAFSGVTQDAYVAWIAGTTPAATPKPVPRGDVIDAIMGGAPYTDGYGFKAPTDLPYYAYFEGHGGHANQHTGIDVVPTSGKTGSPLYTPISGRVVCAGTGVGNGAYGSSCAAFPYELSDRAGAGPGRFEILADDGMRSLILGHVLTSLAAVGSRVKPGDKVARLGGMNGPHVHVEARVWKTGGYTIVDPRLAFPERGEAPVVYDTVDYNLWASNGNLYLVTATQHVTAYQRADPQAVKLGTVSKGETVHAVARVVGQDNAEWWVLADKRRMPTTGTTFTEKVV
jgi:hypothetical protein